MSLPIQGSSAQNQVQQTTVQANKQTMNQVKEMVKDIIDDAQHMLRDALDTSDNAGKFAVKDGNKAVKDQKDMQPSVKNASTAEEAAALLSSDIETEDIKKKKKAKKKFDEKLKGLSTILDQINVEELDEEEQQEVETFQKNLKQLDYLNKQSDLLDSEEEHLTKLLNQ